MTVQRAAKKPSASRSQGPRFPSKPQALIGRLSKDAVGFVGTLLVTFVTVLHRARKYSKGVLAHKIRKRPVKLGKSELEVVALGVPRHRSLAV